MMTNSMLYMTAGLMTLSVSSVQSGFRPNIWSKPIALPRWLPYAALALLAVASSVAGIIFPEATGIVGSAD
jgi:hypothetical protein